MALYIDLHTIQQYPLLYTPDADIYKLRSASKHNYLYLLDLVSKMHNLQKTSFVENTPAICKEVSPTFRFFYGITKLYLPGNSYAFHIKNIQYTLSLFANNLLTQQLSPRSKCICKKLLFKV